MVPPPSSELDINALLETARKDPAYRDLSTEELFLQVTQKLYSALKADKERAASGETRPAESNKVLQAKEWIYADCYIERDQPNLNQKNMNRLKHGRITCLRSKGNESSAD